MSADDAWANLAEALSHCLSDLDEDEFLIVSYKRANYFVQYADQGSYGMRVEASCNSVIGPEAALTSEQYAEMEALGWQRATELLADTGGISEDPDGSPNFFRDLARPLDYASLGTLAVDTFRTVYQVRHPGELQYHAFSLEGDSIRFPTLRLKRAPSD